MNTQKAESDLEFLKKAAEANLIGESAGKQGAAYEEFLQSLSEEELVLLTHLSAEELVRQNEALGVVRKAVADEGPHRGIPEFFLTLNGFYAENKFIIDFATAYGKHLWEHKEVYGHYSVTHIRELLDKAEKFLDGGKSE